MTRIRCLCPGVHERQHHHKNNKKKHKSPRGEYPCADDGAVGAHLVLTPTQPSRSVIGHSSETPLRRLMKRHASP